jgi:alkanesulfonate monooxygenase SsuD/methylene tetrahydromethanopterin reductase-like flavin-dependent oxidoreductase (luciferase family)
MSESTKMPIGLRVALGRPGRERDEALAKIKLADQLGYDSLWIDETWGTDCVTEMTEVVHMTDHVKVGTGIMNVFSRSPGVIASTFATLDERSGGRMFIGLGTSGANVIEHFHGVTYEHPLRRLREYVEIINMLIRGDRLLYEGELYNLGRGFRLNLQRERDHIPVYIAAISPASIAQTGEIADGIIPIHWPKDRYSLVRQRLDRGAQKAARSGSDLVIAPYLTTGYVTDESTRPDAVRSGKERISWYIGRMGVFYKQMLTREGYPEETAAVEAAWETGKDAATDAVPDHMAQNINVVGTPKEIHDQLAELVKGDVDAPLLMMPAGDPDEAGAILEGIIKG